ALVNVHCAPGFVGGVAQVFHWTIGAFRLACKAQCAAVQDDLVRENDPLIARTYLHQILLDLSRIAVSRQLQTTRDALYVRIHHNTIGNLEPCSQNYIGGFACYPGYLQQLVHTAGDLTAEVAQYLARRADNRLRLIAKESSRANVRFKLLGLERGEGFDSRILGEDYGCDHVDPHICALRRKYGRYQQLPRAIVVQRARCRRIAPIEPTEDLADA